MTAIAVLLAGCRSLPMADAMITGKAFSRTRIYIPPDAVFEAILVDVTNETEPPLVLGRQRLEPAGNAPFELAIPYHLSDIKRGAKIVVRAQVTQYERLIFESTGINPVLIDPAFRRVDVVLEPASSSYASVRASVPLQQTYWRLVSIGEDGKGGDLSEPAKDALPPFLQFKVPSARQGEDESIGDFQGAGGCNRFLGSYWLRGAALQLKLQTSSVRLCLEGGKDEPAYLQALTEVTGYAQKGRELVLRGKEGKPVLRFKAEETGEPPYEPWDPPMQPA